MNSKSKEVEVKQKQSSGFSKERPYAGMASFKEGDEKYFHGRSEEIEELSDLIRSRTLTIVYGVSGVGKTSLLRAGVIAELERYNYVAIYIRVNYNDGEHTPIEQTKNRILEELKDHITFNESVIEWSLWELFNSREFSRSYVKPILIFDQFEEIFRASDKQQKDIDIFFTEISDLIENRVPVTFQEKLKQRGETLEQSYYEPKARVIFSLREEYLPELDEFKTYIPSIKSSRFRVKKMLGKAAIEAISKPSSDIINGKSEYGKKVAIEILKKIQGKDKRAYKPYAEELEPWESREVEPFLLSLFLFQLNEKRIKIKTKTISLDLVEHANTKDIIYDSYSESIGNPDSHVAMAIEDQLITKNGNRKLQKLESFMFESKISKKEIEKLEQCRILRQERHGRTKYIELTHDKLAEALKTKRDERRKKKRNKMILRSLIGLLIVLALIVIFLAIRYEKEQARALQEKNKKESYRLAVEAISYKETNLKKSVEYIEESYDYNNMDYIIHYSILDVFYKSRLKDKESLAEKIETKKWKVLEKIKTITADFYATFSPNGHRILTVKEKEARLFELDESSGEILNMNNANRCSIPEGQDLEFRPNAIFSLDGKNVFFRTNKDQIILRWNLDSGTTKPERKEFEHSVRYICPYKDHSLLVFDRDKKVYVWDYYKNLIRAEKEGVEKTTSAEYSLEWETIVALGSYSMKILIEEPAERVIEYINCDTISSVDLSANKKILAIGSRTGAVSLYDLENDWETNSQKDWEAAQTNAINIYQFDDDDVVATRFSDDGTFILAVTNSGSISLIDVASRTRFFEYNLNKDHGERSNDDKDLIRDAFISPGNKYILIVPKRGPMDLLPIDPRLIIDFSNSIVKQGFENKNAEEQSKQ